MAKRSRTIESVATELRDETALHTGTVPAITAEQPVAETAKPETDKTDDKTPGIGDNQPDASEPLPTPERMHAQIESVVADIFRHANHAEKAQQRLAYLFGQRNAVLQAQRAPGAVPSLASLASDKVAFEAYWQALREEFVGPTIDAMKADNEEQAKRVLSATAWNARCQRSLVLAVNLAWCGIDYTAFDHDKSAFPVKPVHLCPQGYVPGIDLAMIDSGTDNARARTSVYLEDDTADVHYFIGLPKGRQYPINTSIRQFIHATRSRILASLSSNVPPGEPNATRQARADGATRRAASAGETARSQAERDKQAAEAAQAAADAAKAKVAAAEAQQRADVLSQTSEQLGDMPTTAAGQARRAMLIANLCAALVKIDTLLADDLIPTVTWQDLTPGAQSGAATYSLWFDRLKGDTADADAKAA